MNGKSAFVARTTFARTASEKRFLTIYSAVLFFCAVLLFALPVTAAAQTIILMSGWALLAATVFSFVRPLIYRRGTADVIMGMAAAVFYAAVGWAVSTVDLYSVSAYRVLFFVIMALAGLSRVTAFARLYDTVTLPVMFVSGIAYLCAAIMLLSGFPDQSSAMFFWVIGMAAAVDAIDIASEALKLKSIH